MVAFNDALPPKTTWCHAIAKLKSLNHRCRQLQCCFI